MVFHTLDGASSLPPPETRLEIKQNSAFLQLPDELLQIITKYMDTGTFFASLLTSRRFLESALSRILLFHHLKRIPGLTLGLTDLPTPDLLLFFRKRAAQSGCAAGALANVTKYAHQSPGITMSNALFIPSDPSQTGNLAQLVTTRYDGVLQIYDLAKDHIRRRVELHIRPEGGCSSTRIEILKVSFSPSSRDLAVLYRQKVHSRNASPFPKRTESACDSEVYRLVTFHRCFAKTLGYFYDSSLQETRDIETLEDQETVGLAFASNGNACIAWKSPDGLNKTRICLVGRNEKIMEECRYDSSPDVLDIHDPSALPAHMYKHRVVSNCQFVDNDSKLNFYKAGAPVHSWYTSCPNPAEEESGPMLSNTASIDIENDGTRQAFEVGMPYYGIHTYSDFSCRISYFALAMSKNLNNYGRTDVFIVHADSFLSLGSCDHSMHLDKGRKQRSWAALALLAGFNERSAQCLSSLGTVVAISPGGTRIAAANWSRVLVWSMNPRVLYQGESQHYFPARDYNMRKGIGRLRPTLLSSEGVVHKMLWGNEVQLYATTDQGLAKWDIGHMSEGRRENLSLAYDVRPEAGGCSGRSGNGQGGAPTFTATSVANSMRMVQSRR